MLPEFSIFSLGLVLLTASLVAIVSRRLEIPYSVGLVIAGIGLALLPNAVDLPLTRDLIFNIFLSPLIFEAARRWCTCPVQGAIMASLIKAW
jgi:CPA1 family monovalent cation:H+ antiporter